MLSVKQGSCEYQFWSHWFDPTRNETNVYRSRSGRSHHSAIWAVDRPIAIILFVCLQTSSLTGKQVVEEIILNIFYGLFWSDFVLLSNCSHPKTNLSQKVSLVTMPRASNRDLEARARSRRNFLINDCEAPDVIWKALSNLIKELNASRCKQLSSIRIQTVVNIWPVGELTTNNSAQ